MPREADSIARHLAAGAKPSLLSAASTEGSLEIACSATLARMLTTWPRVHNTLRQEPKVSVELDS